LPLSARPGLRVNRSWDHTESKWGRADCSWNSDSDNVGAWAWEEALRLLRVAVKLGVNVQSEAGRQQSRAVLLEALGLLSVVDDEVVADGSQTPCQLAVRLAVDGGGAGSARVKVDISVAARDCRLPARRSFAKPCPPPQLDSRVARGLHAPAHEHRPVKKAELRDVGSIAFSASGRPKGGSVSTKLSWRADRPRRPARRPFGLAIRRAPPSNRDHPTMHAVHGMPPRSSSLPSMPNVPPLLALLHEKSTASSSVGLEDYTRKGGGTGGGLHPAIKHNTRCSVVREEVPQLMPAQSNTTSDDSFSGTCSPSSSAAALVDLVHEVSIVLDPGAAESWPATPRTLALPTGYLSAQLPAGYPPAQLPAGYPPAQLPAGYAPAQLPAGYAPAQLPAGYAPAQLPAGHASAQLLAAQLPADQTLPRRVSVNLPSAVPDDISFTSTWPRNPATARSASLVSASRGITSYAL